MTCSVGLPDFYQGQLNAGGIVGGTLQVAVDRNWHVYVGLGLNVGKALTTLSGSPPRSVTCEEGPEAPPISAGSLAAGVAMPGVGS